MNRRSSRSVPIAVIASGGFGIAQMNHENFVEILGSVIQPDNPTKYSVDSFTPPLTCGTTGGPASFHAGAVSRGQGASDRLSGKWLRGAGALDPFPRCLGTLVLFHKFQIVQ